MSKGCGCEFPSTGGIQGDFCCGEDCCGYCSECCSDTYSSEEIRAQKLKKIAKDHHELLKSLEDK